MVVSCYADTSVAEGFEPLWRPHFRAEASRIRQLLAGDPGELAEFEKLLGSVLRALESPEARNAPGVAAFAAKGWDEALAIHSEKPFENRLVVDEEAYLVPLLVADFLRREYLVALVDSHRGRLYECSPGRSRFLLEVDEEVPDQDRADEQGRVKQKDTIVRHRDSHALRFQKHLAERVAKAWDAKPRALKVEQCVY